MALIALFTNDDDDVYGRRKELIERLVAEGYDMLISCCYGPKLETLKDIKYIYDNPEIDRRGTNIKNDYKLLKHYKKLLKQYKPDIVLTFTTKPNVYAGIAAKKLKIPYISNVTGFGSALKKKGLMKKFIMSLFKFAYKGAECIMFQNSTNMKLAIDNKMVGGNYKLIPGSGVALGRYPVQDYPQGGNGTEGDTIVFNYFGRVLKEKGVNDYITAAKIIKEKYPKTEFNILGFIEPTEKHYEFELKEIEANGILFYRGAQSDVKPWIARAHAIIHPSVYGEGMSNVLLENAASGRPIITTDNPGCKETVNDGESGFIYKGGDVDGLVVQIEKFLAIPNENRRNMGLAGRDKVEKEFSRQIVVDTYIDEIRKISV